MNYRILFVCLLLLSTIFLSSCTEDDEPCTETICPDGFNNCVEVPCD